VQEGWVRTSTETPVFLRDGDVHQYLYVNSGTEPVPQIWPKSFPRTFTVVHRSTGLFGGGGGGGPPYTEIRKVEGKLHLTGNRKHNYSVVK
jgi:hypothetical protein